MADEEETTEVSSADLAARLTRWEHLSRVKNYAIVGLTFGLVVALSGWWLTARDHSAVQENGRVGDCRSIQFARTLDGFLPFVTPNHTDEDRDLAADELARLGKLLPRYLACVDDGTEQALRQIASKVPASSEREPFGSCDEARAAGMAPIRMGDSGWNPDLDRDGDGLACE